MVRCFSTILSFSAFALALVTTPASARAQEAAPPDRPQPEARVESTPVPGPPAMPGPPPVPEPPPSEARLRALESRVAEQQAELEKLRSSRDEGVHIRPFDFAGGVRVQLQMLLQVDLVPFRQTATEEVNPSTGAPLNTERFLVRRGRARIVVNSKYVGARFMLDGNTANGPNVRVLEAEALAQWPSPDPDAPPYLALGAGLFRTPFGFELQQQARQRLFLERTNAARAMFGSSFDLGARLFGGYRFLRYSAAAMNGHPVGTGAFELVDPTKSKDFLFRLGVDVPVGTRTRVDAGVSALTGTGFHKGLPSTKDTFAWRDENGNGLVDATELAAVPGSSASPSQTFSRFALGADARLVTRPSSLGELTVQAEVYRGSNIDRTFFPSDPLASGRNLRQFGWTVGAAQQITRYGAIGVRYDWYDPDTDATEQGPQGLTAAPRVFSTVAVTAALVYSPGRLLVEYDINRNPYGRDATGSPTTLKDDTLTIRGEVAF